jgi:hypothetical protein
MGTCVIGTFGGGAAFTGSAKVIPNEYAATANRQNRGRALEGIFIKFPRIVSV